MNYNNRAQNRIATCNEHDNFFGDEFAKPPAELPEAAKKVADEAGPEPPYREGPKEAVLTFSLGLDRKLYQDTYYGEPPQLAIWLEDPEGNTIKTVWVSHRMGKGDWAGAVDRRFALPYWTGRHEKESDTTGPPTFTRPVADAITGPTPKETLVEHVRVPAGGEWPTPKETLVEHVRVPAGSEWLYFVEVNVSGDFNEQFPATFKGVRPDPRRQRPALAGLSRKHQGRRRRPRRAGAGRTHRATRRHRSTEPRSDGHHDRETDPHEA